MFLTLLLFNIFLCQEGNISYLVKRQLKRDMTAKGLDAGLLDKPYAVMEDQPGSNGQVALNETFEKGLR